MAGFAGVPGGPRPTVRPPRSLSGLAPAVALGLALGAFVAPRPALADVKSCVAAHEKGQQARAAGRLRDARDQFLICAADSCPGAVRTDCAKWADDLANRLPSLVLGAKDRSGRDLIDVRVTLDGSPLAEKLDGKSIVVDPGAHSLRFETSGMPSVTQKILVKEGDRARAIDVVFEGGEPKPPVTKPNEGAGGKATVDTGGEKRGAGVLPWVLVGLGGVGVASGLVYSLTAPALPTGCDPSRGTCTKLAGETEEAFAARREQAGKHDTQGTTGLVIAGGGGVVLAVGIVWVLVASSGSSSPPPAAKPEEKKKASRPTFSPWLGQGTGGLSVTGTF